MSLPIRAIGLLASGTVTGVAGLVVGASGSAQIMGAHQRVKLQTACYAERHRGHQVQTDQTNMILQQLGALQERALQEVVSRTCDFLERHAKQVKRHEHLILDGLDRANNQVVSLTALDPDIAGWIQGVVNAATVGAATPAALRTAIAQMATASTGAPISTLSGAAANNATLAWFGGGSVTAGGGGMALGTKVLSVATTGPTLLMTGFTVKDLGTKAQTEADRHRAEVEVLIAQFDVQDEQLRGVQERAREILDILNRLIAEATDALDLLESENFNPELHAERLQKTLILTKSVRDLATAPVVTEQRSAEEDIDKLILKYRHTRKEQ